MEKIVTFGAKRGNKDVVIQDNQSHRVERMKDHYR